MMAAVTSALTSVLGAVGEVVAALTSTDGTLAPLLPLFAIGVSISLVMFGIKCIKGFTWGA